MSYFTWFGAIIGCTLAQFELVKFNFLQFKVTKSFDYFESIISHEMILKPLNILSCTFTGALLGLLTEMTYIVSVPTFTIFVIMYVGSLEFVTTKIKRFFVYKKVVKSPTSTDTINSVVNTNKILSFTKLEDYNFNLKNETDIIKHDDIEKIESGDDNNEETNKNIKLITSTSEVTLKRRLSSKVDRNIMF